MKNNKIIYIILVVVNILNKEKKEHIVNILNKKNKEYKVHEYIHEYSSNKYSSNKLYLNKKSLFNNLFNNIFNNIDFPTNSSYTQISIFYINKYINALNLTSEMISKTIILDNKIFSYKIIPNKNSNKLIIMNPGIATFSNSELNIFHYLDDLTTDYNIIILFRDYYNIEKTQLYYEPFDMSKYLDLFIKNIILTYNFKNIYISGMSGGCLTVLKYLLYKKNKLPDEIKACLLISCSPKIRNNILKINRVISNKLKDAIINEINKLPNNYNLNKELSLYDTIGIIGSKNFNFNDSSEYYEFLDFDLNELSSIKLPLVFLNSLDDNIAYFEHISESLDKLLINKNIALIATHYGSHCLFFNKKKNFLSYITSNIFSNF